MQLKYPINLHKGLTAFYVVGLMLFYHNFTIGPFVYLALHGSYGCMWLMKGRMFPDRQWERVVTIPYAVFVFVILGLYWIAPFILISGKIVPPPEILATSIALTVFGTMLHFGSDAQKFFTLKYRSGLITEGFFARMRNVNYLGEFMIYSGFALLSMTWIGGIGIALFFIGEFIPNMLKKDKSLSRYPDFADYKQRSGFFFPKLF
jgi:steroid 5-alpha reductase family enzyme